MISEDSYSENDRRHEELPQKHGRWEPEECESFVKFYDLFGDNWKQISKNIGTRTAEQVRSHAQKYFIKVEREKQKQRRKECQKKNVPTEMENRLRPRARDQGYYTNLHRSESEPKQGRERRKEKRGKGERVDVETQTEIMFPPPITFPFYLQFLSPYLFRQNVPVFFKQNRG